MVVGPPGRSPSTPVGSQDFARFSLIGRSPSFLRCLNLIERIAGCDAGVVIQGETGTGKELAARAIHYLGARSGKPFVPLNCGAIPDGLIETELFGHEKGAFTDARSARSGVIAQARDGTLFLDEIDTLSHKGQIAVLRFVQDFRYRPVGHHSELRSDARIIAASNRRLGDLTRGGDFRVDLLYRLNILCLALPPLRERDGDVELLANHFARIFAGKYGQTPKRFACATVDWMHTHDWPGNVRELENLVHREVLMTDGDVITYTGESTDSDKSTHRADRTNFQTAKLRAIEQFERSYLTRTLSEARGNITFAAQMACKERRSFAKLLKKHGIDRNAYRA
jgi:DNA-binding NtrC family response regulator